MSKSLFDPQDQYTLASQHESGLLSSAVRNEVDNPGRDVEPVVVGFQALGPDVCQQDRPPTASADSQSNIEDKMPLQGRDASRVKRDSAQQLDSDLDGWHPVVLQKRMINAFMATFALLIVVLETIFIISKKNRGLTESSSGLHYLWTYGPTAILTGLAAVWACVDYSAKVAVPWTRAKDNEAAVKESLLLDYVSPLSFLIPYQAMRKRDTLVTATATVSSLLAIMTILSPSLIKLTLVKRVVPLQLQTEFVYDPSRLARPDLLPLYDTIGLKRYNLSYPDGISKQFVYQSVSPSSTNVSELHATVEGLSVALECEPAELEKLEAFNTSLNEPFTPLTLKLSTPGCDLEIFGQVSPFNLFINSISIDPVESGFGRILTGRCRGSPSGLNSNRLAWVIADILLVPSLLNNSIVEVSSQSSQQMICKPSYNISDVKILRDSEHVSQISLAEDPHVRQSPNLHAWDIASSTVDALNEPSGTGDIISDIGKAELNNTFSSFDLDLASTAILGLAHDSYLDVSSAFNYKSLVPSLQSYYGTHSLFLVRETLVESTSKDASGYAILGENRLFVQTLVCQVLVGLCLLSILALIPALCLLPPHFSLSGDPRSIMGLMVLARDFIPCFPQDLGASDATVLKDRVRNSAISPRVVCDAAFPPVPGQRSTKNAGRSTKVEKFMTSSHVPVHELYRPFVLRPCSRILVCISIAGIILLLEILLQKSGRDKGIGTVQNDTYLHYLWTLLPTFVLSLIAIFFSSLDSELRGLMPFLALSKVPTSSDRSIELNLRGLLPPQVLYREMRLGNFAAAIATLTAILASLLTITSGSMFFENENPLTSKAQLRMTGSFTKMMYSNDYVLGIDLNPGYVQDDLGIIPSLVLGRNLSYPAFTFERLAFPELALEITGNPDRLTTSNVSGLEMHAVVPALRGGLDCYHHPQTDISADFLHAGQTQNLTTLFQTPWPTGDTIRVNIAGEFCSSWPYNPLFGTALFPLGDLESLSGVFGASSGNVNITLFPCSDFIYVWGNYSRSADGRAQSISVSALSCNASIEAVDVEAVFVGADLAIKPESPPAPKEGTSRVVIAASSSKETFQVDIYGDLYSLPVENGTLLDNFFSVLIMSQYAVPLSALSDPAKVEAITDAIQLQHSIIVAQVLSRTARIPLLLADDPGVFNWTGEGTYKSTTYAATVLNSQHKQLRVVQDATSTRIVQGLLAGTLLLAALSWGIAPRTAVLPRPPTSVASVLALLVDGNIYTGNQSRMKGLKNTSAKDIRAMFGEKPLFRLGMGSLDSPRDAEPQKNDNSRFAIWLVDST